MDKRGAQRIHYEKGIRMFLVGFVAGFTGISGRQFSFSNPQSLDQAMKTAIPVQEAGEKGKRLAGAFTLDSTIRSEEVRLT